MIEKMFYYVSRSIFFIFI